MFVCGCVCAFECVFVRVVTIKIWTLAVQVQPYTYVTHRSSKNAPSFLAGPSSTALLRPVIMI